LDRRLGGPQSWSGHSGLEKNSQPLLGIEPQNPDRPVRSPEVETVTYDVLSQVWHKLEYKMDI